MEKIPTVSPEEGWLHFSCPLCTEILCCVLWYSTLKKVI